MEKRARGWERASFPPAMSPGKFHASMAALATQDANGYWDFLDPIEGHKQADELMLQLLEALGYEEGCAIFRDSDKWYA